MFDYLVALYHFGADYHSGQWSNGYRWMCLAKRYLGQWFDYTPSLDDILTHEQGIIFFTLAEKYQKVA